jgi:hypothetical protein
MALSRLAAQFAAEINQHDWSDAPYRADKAGHRNDHDRQPAPQLTQSETGTIRMNVMWVTAQVLGYNDPNFDVYEYARACGVDTSTPSGRPNSGAIRYGLRIDGTGRFHRPGAYEPDEEPVRQP